MRCYVGTTLDHEEGEIITAIDPGVEQNECSYEAILEERRPERCRPRFAGPIGTLDPTASSVFFDGAQKAHVVDVVGDYERSDMGWILKMEEALGADDPSEAERFADKFWAGEKCDRFSITEIRMSKARVLREALDFERHEIGGDELVSGESAETIRYYMSDRTHLLAVEMHRQTGWNIEVFVVPLRDWVETARTPVKCVMVSDPEGRLWHVGGRTRHDPRFNSELTMHYERISYSSEDHFFLHHISDDASVPKLPMPSREEQWDAMVVSRRVLSILK